MKRPAQLASPRSLPKVSQPGQMRRAAVLRAANDNTAPLRLRLRGAAVVALLMLFLVFLLLAV